jgi:hypothetical protein
MWDCKHHTRLEVVVISYYSIVWSFLYHEHNQDAMTMTLASSCSTNSHESGHEISFIHENVTKIHHTPHNIKIRWRANWWHHWSKVEGSSHLFGWKLKTTSGSMAAMTTAILQGQLGFSFHLKTSMRLPATAVRLIVRMSNKCCMLWPSCWQVSRFSVSRMLKTMHRGCCKILNKKSTVTPTTCIVLLAWQIWTLIIMSFLDPRGGARSEWWKPKKASCCWDVH